jgi:hypothetical protein
MTEVGPEFRAMELNYSFFIAGSFWQDRGGESVDLRLAGLVPERLEGPIPPDRCSTDHPFWCPTSAFAVTLAMLL